MKQICRLLYLLLICIISCKSANDKKSGSIITNNAGQKKPDNFILDNTSAQDNGPVYMYCENMPEFPGGESAFIEYMRKNINYPKPAVAVKKEGRVVVKFIVNSAGEIGNVEIIRKQRPDMNDECIRAVTGMPKWKPGMLDGKPVSVSYNVTVRFLLTYSENLNGIYILPSKSRQR